MHCNESSILIVGEAMIDHYLFGENNRTSPVAPVPIVDKNFIQSYNLGGVANSFFANDLFGSYIWD